MAATDRIWRGGAYTLREAGGDASADGDFDYDTGANSNWIDEDGAVALKPTSTNKIIFNEFADRVPANYSNSTYPHVAGKHWCCCKNMDQGGIDANGFLSTRGFTGDIYGYSSKTLDAAVAVDKGGGQVGIPLTAHGFAAGDYVTIGLTVYYNGEYRIVSVTANEFVITATYVAETFVATNTAKARTPLRISVSGIDTYDMVIESDSTIYIECGSTTPNIPNLIFNSVTGLLHLSSEAGTGNFDDILVLGDGTLDIADDTHFTKVTVSGDSTNANIIVGQGCIGPAAASADLDAYAGTITWDSKIGDVLLPGGVVTYCQNVDLATTVDIDLLQGYGGTFNWYGKSTLTDYKQYAGTVTALGDGDKVIGSGSTTAYPLHGGTFDLSQAGGRVTFGGSVDSIDKQGGELKPANRSNVSW